jgi:glycerol-3-phosphate dehydrogenase
VAGGKYTTHRKMAEEIVDYTLKAWRRESRGAKKEGVAPFPEQVRSSRTRAPVNPKATGQAVELCRSEAMARNLKIPEELLSRYGADAITVLTAHAEQSRLVGGNAGSQSSADPEGFPVLAAQLRHAIRSELVMHLEDFYLRRVPLYAARADHGLPWAEELARVWAEERGLNEAAATTELARLKAEVAARSAWKK